MNDGLSSLQRETIRQILSTYGNQIMRVDIFGSRAKGTQRPNSDLDLVLHGVLDDAAIDRLWTLFQESNLPFSVDVKNYAQIRYAPLRAHMDNVCKILFTHEDLIDKRQASKQSDATTGASLKEIGYDE